MNGRSVRATRSGRRAPLRSEGGFTLVEMVLVVGLMVGVVGVLLGSFDSFTRAQRRQDGTLDVRQELRQAITEIDHDLRAATGMLAPSSGLVATTSLELAITAKNGTAAKVRFRVDTSSAQLLRETITVAGGAATSTRVLARRVPSSSAAVFHYYGPTGTELNPLSVTPAVLASCTTRIRVDLHDSAVGGPSDASLTLDGAARSVRPEETSC